MASLARGALSFARRIYGFGDFVGSVGVTLILVAFLANLAGKLAGGSAVYQALNAVGAALAATSSVMVGFWPFVVLEGVWCLAALLALAHARPFASGER